MLNKLALKLGVAGFAVVAFAGCENPFSKDSGSSNAVADASDTVADYTRGTAVETSNVVGMSVLAEDGSAATTEHLNEVFAKYPELAERVGTLDAVDTVTRTEQGFLELNGADGMMIALKLDGASASVAHTDSGFAAESIAYSEVEAGQAQGGSQLRFVLRSCAVEEKEPEQEQGQEVPDKGQEVPDKGQDVPDKGQEIPDKGQEKVEDCASLTVILDLSQPEQKQEQGKDEEVDKGQDKGQDVPDKGQDVPDKGQEVPDKGQDQGQDQEAPDKGGKDAPDQGEEDQAPAPGEGQTRAS